MAFNRQKVSRLLAQCHRRCCVCHKFCGVKMETHHIEQNKDDKDHIDNCVPVCFECHAEIKLYNPDHPRGRKFLPDELRKHKKQWLEICRNNPAIFVNPLQRSDVGPVQSLIDEMEFNLEVAEHTKPDELGCMFRVLDFGRVITEGLLSLLTEDLKKSLIKTYRKIKKINTLITAVVHPGPRGGQRSDQFRTITSEMPLLQDDIMKTHEQLLTYLGGNEG